MAFILKKAILASRLEERGGKTSLGEKVEIKAGSAIEKGDDIPGVAMIVINFNGEKFVTDKGLLEKAIQR